MADVLTKGFIGKDDFSLYDGGASTFNRRTSTGGLQTLNRIDWIGIDVYQNYGEKTSGAIIDALSLLATTSKIVLFLSPGNWELDQNLDFSPFPQVFIKPANGALFTQKAGTETLTVYSPENIIAAPSQQITAVDMIDFAKGGTVYPHWWGAKDGISCSNAFQYCVNSIATVGGIVKPLPGIYTAYGLQTYSGIKWQGPGWQYCEIKDTTGSNYVLSINQGSGGTTDPADNEMNIEICGIHFSGAVATLGFSEHVHVLNFNAVSYLYVHHCKISGFRGDGIYLGSSNVAGTERHNEHVQITHNFFDGINNDNRQGISVIDCDDLLIAYNYFTRTTRSNQPGAIDVEPDAYTFPIIKNIRIIGNTIKDCGGNISNISIVLNQATLTVQPENITIGDNYFPGTSTVSNGIAILFGSGTVYTRSLNIEVSGNRGNVTNPVLLYGVIDGLRFMYNDFTCVAAFGQYAVTDTLKNSIICNNRFNGDDIHSGLVIRGAVGLIIHSNVFKDIADYSIILGIGAGGATVDQVIISNNIFVSSEVGVEFSSGTFTNIQIRTNDFSGCTSSPYQGTVPADCVVTNNVDWITEKGGSTGAIASGATVAHGLYTTPTIVSVIPKETGLSDIYVTASATNLTITYAGGGTHDFWWEAKKR